jgi:predicted transcriptional regulator YdeE
MKTIFLGTLKIKATKVIGSTTQLSKSQTQNYKIITSHWKSFNHSLHEINSYDFNNPEWLKYGISYLIDQEYFYSANIPFDDGVHYPDYMQQTLIEEGDIAHFQHIGSMESLKLSIFELFKFQIPSLKLNLKYLKTNGIVYYERYSSKFQWNSDNSIIDLFFPITSE